MQTVFNMFLIAALTTSIPVHVSAQPLSIAAAADLRAALETLKPVFEARHPGVKLQISYGASGSLTAQIQQGAPFDVFLSADLGFPESLGAAAESPVFTYATGRLALWVRNDLGLDPAKDALQVLLDPSVKRIAIANPKVAPYGRSAEATLRTAGLYETVKPRLVLGENVAQAAQFLQSGAAEAGFISLSQSRHPTLSRMGQTWTVPQGMYPLMKQGGILLKRSNQIALASAFRDFLLGTEGRECLLGLGFGVP